MPTHVTRPAAAAALAFLLTQSAAAHAQCVGDCDDSNSVMINELITGVTIALGSAQLSTCVSFDLNDSEDVEINELVLGVGNALNGCPPLNTPTSTPTVGEPTATSTIVEPTPSATGPSPTATRTPLPLICGDGIANISAGETCDDGNTLDGDACPADCRIEPCQASGEKLTAEVTFTTDAPELQLIALTVFVKYPDGVVDVPGLAGDPAVVANVTSEVFAVTPTDFNYGTTVVLIDPFQGGYPSGTVAALITYDRCQGAGAPQPGDFTCDVTDAVDTGVNTVTDQVSCAVALR